MKTRFALALSIVAFAVTPQASGDDFSYSDLFKFGDSTKLVKGGSTLTRTEHGLSMSVSINELKKSHVYTVWWVIFNNPGACLDGCNGPDLDIGAVDGAVIWAAGAIADQHGNARFSGHLAAGARPEGMDTFGDLSEPMTAEVHFVVRKHPKAKKGEVAAGMATFAGNCDAPTDCSDDFASVHLPP